MQPKRGPSANSQLRPAKRRISLPAHMRDSSEGGCSIASTIQGQNSTLSSLLNNCRVADINQCVTSTPSTTQQRSLNPLISTVGTSSRITPASGGTSTCHVVFSAKSGIAITATPLSGLQNVPTTNPHAGAHISITNPI
jgi:hypothetical protein